MRVTEAGKAIFRSAMERVGKDVCRIEVQVDPSGREGLSIGLVSREETRRLVNVDGVDFDLAEETEAQLSHYVFDGDGTNLVVRVTGCGCGHCHGHAHDEPCDHDCDCDHDGGCGCGCGD